MRIALTVLMPLISSCASAVLVTDQASSEGIPVHFRELAQVDEIVYECSNPPDAIKSVTAGATAGAEVVMVGCASPTVVQRRKASELRTNGHKTQYVQSKYFFLGSSSSVAVEFDANGNVSSVNGEGSSATLGENVASAIATGAALAAAKAGVTPTPKTLVTVTYVTFPNQVFEFSWSAKAKE